ncbi:MAG: hypothetical protein NTV34_12145, partial [Proteobacteria bacterium]|nr:hypothetical protein [Pseudomonadota bacterium]
AATIKWKKAIATEDLLTFIEQIPYKETRAYVKLILRNYFYYKRWYGGSEVLEERHLKSIAVDLIAMSKNPPAALQESNVLQEAAIQGAVDQEAVNQEVN